MTDNMVTMDILPQYQSAIIYFSVIRNSWAPFSDLLRVDILADSDLLEELFVEYQRRV